MVTQLPQAAAVCRVNECLRAQFRGESHTRPAAFKRFLDMDFKTWTGQFGDAALEFVAKWLANHYHLKRLGRITGLKLNRGAQEVFLALDLHGEREPIELTVHYRVVSPTELEIATVQASRPWMTEFINGMVPAEQKRLEVSPLVIRILTSRTE